VSRDDTSPSIIDSTRLKMMKAIRSKTLRNLVIVYRYWRSGDRGELADQFSQVMAPSTRYIMEILGCSRRSAHDYRVTIQFLVEEDNLIALLKSKESI